MRKVLLDTDMLSEILKGKDTNVEAHKNRSTHTFEQLSFSSASVLEILFGLHRKAANAQAQRAQALFARNDEIVPDREDYRLAAETAGALSRRGTPIGLVDPLIAACATRRGMTVATGNAAHFGFMQDAGFNLTLEDWRQPPSVR